ELQVIEEELRNNNDMLLEAQKVLDTERQRYQDLFEFAPDAYLVTDENGKVIEANQNSTQLLGLTLRSLIGKPLNVFIIPADHPIFNHLLASLHRHETLPPQELRFQPRHRGEITASVKVALAEGEGKAYTLRWTIRDISARKLAETLIRQNALRNAVLSEVSQSLAEASLDEKAILDIVVRTTARLVGDSCVITLGSEDGQWLRPVAWSHKNPDAYKRMSALYNTLHAPTMVGPSGHVFQSSKPLLIKEFTSEGPGESIPSTYQNYLDLVGISSLLIVPIQIGGKTIGTLGITRDQDGQPYTEDDQSMLEILATRTSQSIHNARLYQELQNSLRKELETHDQLVQSEKFSAVGRLLASITHEINNPLQTIKNCLYLSQMDTQPGTPVYDALNIATAETTRLSNLVAQLREIYRPPTHGVSKPVDLPTLVNEVQVLLVSYLQDKRIQWEVSPPQDERFYQLTVEGVPDQLKQVFLNICLNAIDAMETQGGSLKIEFKVGADASLVGVCFQDSGPGLPPEVKAKLFEPFITTKEKGLGLGLVICYDIIQKHNGHIDIDSEPGKGATFTIWLPAKRETA
ncbi:MAG TPA: ATP-binding protein, partial [Anaerolineales bacterium]|nr:ATP-binding protein [Anaerolineales bacterium]